MLHLVCTLEAKNVILIVNFSLTINCATYIQLVPEFYCIGNNNNNKRPDSSVARVLDS